MTPAWVALAECATSDPEIFYPEKGQASVAKRAKLICSGCDVRGQCLDDALEKDERFGIRGGLTEDERRKLRRRRLSA